MKRFHARKHVVSSIGRTSKSFLKYGSILLIAVLCMGILTACSEGERTSDDAITKDTETMNDVTEGTTNTQCPENDPHDNEYVYALVGEAYFVGGNKTNERRYTYDDSGRLIRIDVDADWYEEWNEKYEVYEYLCTADGIINTATFFEYDENGYVVKKWTELPQSGRTSDNNFEYKYTFDADGNATCCAEYHDGEISYTEFVCEFSWENGKLTWENLRANDDWSYDVNAGSYGYSYDSEGRVNSYSVIEDSQIITVSIVYGEHGKMAQLRAKLVGTSEEEVFSYTFDSEGNLLPVEDEDVEFKYDAYGNIILILGEDGDYIQYKFQKTKTSNDCRWTGNDIALIRQADNTQYSPLFIPGLNYAIYIFDLD